MCEKKRICQIQERFTTKICFRGNLFREYRHQSLVVLAQKAREKTFFFTVHMTGEEVEIVDEVSVKELAR